MIYSGTNAVGGHLYRISAHVCQFSTLLPPFTSFHFLLSSSLSLSVRTLSWKTNKELQKLWRNEKSLKKICILYLVLVCLSIIQPLTEEDGNKRTIQSPLLSYRDYTENDFLLNRNPPCPLCPHCCWPPPSLKLQASFMDASPRHTVVCLPNNQVGGNTIRQKFKNTPPALTDGGIIP